MSRLTFPKTKPSDLKLDFMAQHRMICAPGLLNPYVPVDMQVLGDDTCLVEAEEAGVQVHLTLKPIHLHFE